MDDMLEGIAGAVAIMDILSASPTVKMHGEILHKVIERHQASSISVSVALDRVKSHILAIY